MRNKKFFNKTTLRDKKRALQRVILGKTCRVLLFLIVIIFGVLYIAQINTVSTKGFVISDLQKEIALLEQENNDLKVKISTFRSMYSIQNRLDDLNLVAVEDLLHKEFMPDVVARR